VGALCGSLHSAGEQSLNKRASFKPAFRCGEISCFEIAFPIGFLSFMVCQTHTDVQNVSKMSWGCHLIVEPKHLAAFLDIKEVTETINKSVKDAVNQTFAASGDRGYEFDSGD
jgi:hypothetical protein